MELTATPIAPADALSESIDMFWNCSRVQRRDVESRCAVGWRLLTMLKLR